MVTGGQYGAEHPDGTPHAETVTVTLTQNPGEGEAVGREGSREAGWEEGGLWWTIRSRPPRWDAPC